MENVMEQLDGLGELIDKRMKELAIMRDALDSIVLIAEGRGGLYETICKRAHKALSEVA